MKRSVLLRCLLRWMVPLGLLSTFVTLAVVNWNLSLHFHNRSTISDVPSTNSTHKTMSIDDEVKGRSNATREQQRTEQRRRKQQEKQQQETHEPLNVIILYPDDWRHDDLGDDVPILETPFFSWLATQGIRFTQNAVTTSICWISRATLFSGQWVSRHGSTFLFRASFMNQWQHTWPHLLQQYGGYFVGHVGKWQYRKKPGQYLNFSSFFEGNMWYGNVHTATRARDQAIRFLTERPKDRPFALTVAFYPPKGASDPQNAPPDFLSFYQNQTIPEPYNRSEALLLLPPFLQGNETEARLRYNYRFEDVFDYQTTMSTYYAMLSYLDKMCQQIVDELKDQGILNRTMIIVSADNGEFHSAHALADKWYPYQESIRVPLIIYDPRMPQQKRGTRDDSLTLNVDLASTILGAAGIQADDAMQGRDIADLYLETNNPSSTEPWRTDFYYEFPKINGKIPASRAVVNKKFKYIEWNDHNYEQLFNLQDDPLEFHDLANSSALAGLKDSMKQRLQELRHQLMAPNVPGTVCDPLWPPRTDLKPLPLCSPDIPTLCCPNTTSSLTA